MLAAAKSLLDKVTRPFKRKHADESQDAGAASGPPPAKRRAAPVLECKVVLVGDGGVGKTTLTTRHQSGDFTQKYLPTMGVEIRRLSFATNCGTVVFNVWDTAGQDKFGGLRDGYYLGAEAVIVMFDVTSRVTYSHVPKWFADVQQLCGNIPCVLVGNKTDCREREVKAHQVTWHRSRGIQYYDMSAKSGFNVEKPFLYLARRLCNNQDLRFVGEVATMPCFSRPSDAARAALELEQLTAMNVAVPDDDDDL